MSSQLIKNWDDLYEGDGIPQWEDLDFNSQFCDFVSGHATGEMRILELGAGLGHNAIHLARQGLNIIASDISNNAMERCQSLARKSNVPLESRVIDICNITGNEGLFDMIYEKGCWHSFFDDNYREQFVTAVFSLLKENGYWVSSSGSADNDDDPNDPDLETYPRLTLQQISKASEEHFKIKKVQTGWYGGNRVNFQTWECLFQKRPNKKMHQTQKRW
nr:class I SAM-dependent methyltransferase [uncultured Desulfobacter sp.]